METIKRFLESVSTKYGDRNRRKKYELFLGSFSFDKNTTIIDVGASEHELRECANILEKKYNWPENITALGVEKYEKFIERYPRVKAVVYPGDRFPFSDKSYDVCWSNAVLEHVGSRDAQINFLREIRRVAKNGFVTTPNRYFPMELHTRFLFLHYLPKRIFDWILRKTHNDWATGSYMNLLNLRQLRIILNTAGIEEYKIVANRCLGFIVDFVIIF